MNVTAFNVCMNITAFNTCMNITASDICMHIMASNTCMSTAASNICVNCYIFIYMYVYGNVSNGQMVDEIRREEGACGRCEDK